MEAEVKAYWMQVSAEGLPALLNGSVQALVLAATDPGSGVAGAAAAASSNGSGAGPPARRVSLTQQDFARVRCAAHPELHGGLIMQNGAGRWERSTWPSHVWLVAPASHRSPVVLETRTKPVCHAKQHGCQARHCLQPARSWMSGRLTGGRGGGREFYNEPGHLRWA